MAKKSVRKSTPSKPAAKNGAHRGPTDHAYFLSLEVSNIRCFGTEAQRLDLSKPDGTWAPWTIILGNNGTGKSTLLQALAGLRVENEWRSTVAPDELSPESTEHRKTKVWNSLSLFLKFGEDGIRSGRSQLVSKIASSLDVGGYRRSFGIELQERLHQLDSTHETQRSLQTTASWTGRRQPLTETAFFAYGAWRRLGRSELGARIELPCVSVEHLFDEMLDLINAEEWLLRADYAATKKSAISEELRMRLEAVRSTLLQLFPDNEVTDIRISTPDERYPNPRVLFTTPYGEVELRQLGYGYQSLITWVVDFAARMFETYPDSPQPLAEPAVCLIDEIDLHLHPTWQRKVMRYLSDRFPKTQFVATAHSPLIVQAAADMQANVAVLRREGDHVVIDNNPISVQGWRADQILASELFDVPLRSESSEQIVQERTRLLSQAKLSKADKSRLQELESRMAGFPVGSTSAERALNDRLQSAVELLEKVARKPQS